MLLTFASFITTPIDALRILSTLLNMPSASRKGRTISIDWLASDASVSETSQSLIVNEVTARHSLSPAFRTVSLMSSMARNAATHIFFKCFPTYMTRMYGLDFTGQELLDTTMLWKQNIIKFFNQKISISCQSWIMLTKHKKYIFYFEWLHYGRYSRNMKL